MNKTVAAEVARLETLTVNQLVSRFEDVFGEQCRSRHKRYLIRRIAWRLQANAEGGLSERARKRAGELACEADIRVTPPPERKANIENPHPDIVKIDTGPDPRLPPPGNWIERQYKGRMIRVLVVQSGFEYEGERFGSLSGIAKVVTGTHVNGFRFFQLLGDR